MVEPEVDTKKMQQTPKLKVQLKSVHEIVIISDLKVRLNLNKIFHESFISKWQTFAICATLTIQHYHRHFSALRFLLELRNHCYVIIVT
jgi:hypothetical protein